MNKGIYLCKEEIDTILEKLRIKQKELIDFINKQKKLHEKMHLIWSGTSGDKAYESLKKHEKKYESYLKAINARIDFLERAENAYIALDDYLNKKISFEDKIG